MSATLDKNTQEQALLNVKAEFKRVLESLPIETAEDLIELLGMHKHETDAKVKSGIAQTIEEILFPSSMIVDLKEEYDLEQESPDVRERVKDYRQKSGECIRARRVELGMSQDDLANLAGISQSHVCRLETGVHVPTHATIQKVAEALKIHPSMLDPGFPSDEEC